MTIDPGRRRQLRLKVISRWLPFKLAVVLPLAAALAMLGFDTAAAAAVNAGPCRFFINGVQSTEFNNQEHALRVASDQDLVVSGQVDGKFIEYKAWIRYADFKYLAASGTSNGPSFSRVVNVKTYARYGVGIYKVLADATVLSRSGGDTCANDAYVYVTGNPMTTAAGLAAAGAGALGLGGVVAGAAESAGEEKGTTDNWEKEDERLRQERREIRKLVPELGCIGCLLPMSLLGVLTLLGLFVGISALWSSLA